jgi:GntR family transcriptional regulator/MocR family aminotransferase
VARKSSADSGSPAIDQLALAHLLASGEYERHIAAARRAYRRRRDLLVRTLATRGPRMQVRGAAAGMQLPRSPTIPATSSVLTDAGALAPP